MAPLGPRPSQHDFHHHPESYQPHHQAAAAAAQRRDKKVKKPAEDLLYPYPLHLFLIFVRTFVLVVFGLRILVPAVAGADAVYF